MGGVLRSLLCKHKSPFDEGSYAGGLAYWKARILVTQVGTVLLQVLERLTNFSLPFLNALWQAELKKRQLRRVVRQLQFMKA